MSELRFIDEFQRLTENPIIFTISVPIIAMSIVLVVEKPLRHLSGAVTVLAMSGGLAAAISLAMQSFSNPTSAKVVAPTWSVRVVHELSGSEWLMGLTFRADALTSAALVSFGLIFLITALYSYGAARHLDVRSYHYFFFLLAYVGACGAALAGDLFTLYIFWELITLAVAALIFWPLSSSNVAAARKWLFASIGVSIPMFFSIVWLLTETGAVGFRELWGKQIVADFNSTGLAVGAILLAFAVRSGLFPLHAWLVDAAGSANPPVGIILTSVMTQVGAYSTMRVILAVFEPGTEWRVALGMLGALSAILAAVGAMQRNGYNRSLGYLATGQMGFVFIALGAATPLGEAAALFQLVSFSTYFPLLFIAASEVRRSAPKSEGWLQIVRSAPIAFLSLVIGVLGVAGVPPLNGFGPHVLLCQALLAEGTTASQALLFGAAVATAMTAAAAVDILIRTLAGEEKGEELLARSTWWNKAPMAVLSILSIALGLMSNLVLFDLIRPLVAAVRTMPTVDVPTRADTLIVVEATLLFLVFLIVGAAAYLKQKEFLREPGVPYAGPIGTVSSPVLRLAPIYRAFSFILERGLFDAYNAANIALRTAGDLAFAIVYVLATRHAPDLVADVDQEDESRLPQPRTAPQ